MFVLVVVVFFSNDLTVNQRPTGQVPVVNRLRSSLLSSFILTTGLLVVIIWGPTKPLPVLEATVDREMGDADNEIPKGREEGRNRETNISR